MTPPWCQERRTALSLDPAGLSAPPPPPPAPLPPPAGSKRAAEASRCFCSHLAPAVISVTNAFWEQIVAVACLVHQEAALLRLIRVTDDSATSLHPSFMNEAQPGLWMLAILLPRMH